MEEKFYLDIVINKEMLSNGKDVFVSHCTTLGIASQGKTIDEALTNIKEAVGLYLEEQPEKCAELSDKSIPSFSVIEVIKNAETPCIIR